MNSLAQERSHDESCCRAVGCDKRGLRRRAYVLTFDNDSSTDIRRCQGCRVRAIS